MKNILNKIKEVLISKRFKSFYWRLGAMVVSAICAFIVQTLTDYKVPVEIIGVVGLVFGEITKWFNKKTV